jgi:hypothetical protein
MLIFGINGGKWLFCDQTSKVIKLEGVAVLDNICMGKFAPI